MLNYTSRLLIVFCFFIFIYFFLLQRSFVYAQYALPPIGFLQPSDPRSCDINCGQNLPCKAGYVCKIAYRRDDGVFIRKCRNPACPDLNDCCCPPSAPSNLSPTGTVYSDDVIFTWTNPPTPSDNIGYTITAYRIDDLENGWCDSSCDDPPNCTLYPSDYCDYTNENSFIKDLVHNHTYDWWVHSIRACYVGKYPRWVYKWSDATHASITASDSAPTPTLTPTPTTDPSAPTPTPTTDPSAPTPTPTTDPSAPTPTPTPGAWYKLKNASLYKNGEINISTPTTIQAFDSDDTIDQYLVVGNPGVVTSTNTISYYPDTWKSSVNQWQNTEYNFSSQSLISNFYDYIKARKTYEIQTIDSLVDGKVNVVKSDSQSIDASSFSTNIPPLVIIIRKADDSDYGDLVITEDADYSNIVFLAKSITFRPVVESVSGIFIADSIDIQSTTNGLKIVGNLISNSSVEIPGRTDVSKPSLFVVVDPDQYVSLLPLISTSKYDFQQTQ